MRKKKDMQETTAPLSKSALRRQREREQRLETILGAAQTLFAAEGYRLPQLTTVWMPDGVDDAAVRSNLLQRYGIEIGGGLGAYAGRVWRIGCMGHTARMRNVRMVLAALGEELDR